MGQVIFKYENGISISWNGSATFNVFNDRHNTECFTDYGATTTTKAHAIADNHYEEMYIEWQQELAMDSC